MHEALNSLIREKSYDHITVAENLERAIYIHSRDKGDLLASSMRVPLLAVPLVK